MRAYAISLGHVFIFLGGSELIAAMFGFTPATDTITAHATMSFALSAACFGWAATMRKAEH